LLEQAARWPPGQVFADQFWRFKGKDRDVFWIFNSFSCSFCIEFILYNFKFQFSYFLDAFHQLSMCLPRVF